MRHRLRRSLFGLLLLLSAATVLLITIAGARATVPDPRDRQWIEARPDPAARPRIEAAFRSSLPQPLP
jgi:hypothetical protein